MAIESGVLQAIVDKKGAPVTATELAKETETDETFISTTRPEFSLNRLMIPLLSTHP